MDPTDPGYSGQQHYTPAFLKIYDVLVLRIYGPLVWRCPTGRLTDQYTRHVGRRHMDVGPGTGYFLQHAKVSSDTTVLLVDPNRAVLAHASRRLSHLNPSVL